MDYTTAPAVVSPPVRCDWLDVTFPVGCALWDDVSGFLLDQHASVKRSHDGGLEFRLPGAEWGNVQLFESSRGWSRLSASGGSLEALRRVFAFNEYLAIIGGHPHTLTRLDACMDLFVPGPNVIGGLVNRYPADSLVYLTRKGVRTDYNLQPVFGGGLTGTFYAGPLRYGKSKVSARVYDKQREVLSRTGVDVGPLTRYEVTARKGYGITLRDAQYPLPLFWHIASPALLNAPADVPAWVPCQVETWCPGARPVDDMQRLRSRVSSSVDLAALVELADKVGESGRLDLLRLLRSRLGLSDYKITKGSSWSDTQALPV